MSCVCRSRLRGICCSLLAKCGTFTGLLANERVNASGILLFRGFFLGRGLSLHSREAIEEQLDRKSVV